MHAREGEAALLEADLVSFRDLMVGLISARLRIAGVALSLRTKIAEKAHPGAARPTPWLSNMRANIPSTIDRRSSSNEEASSASFRRTGSGKRTTSKLRGSDMVLNEGGLPPLRAAVCH